MTPFIETKDYSWRYLQSSKPALEKIDLTINEGEFIGIIGPNGSGKTTLAYSFDGLIPGQYNGIKGGTVHVLGREVEEYHYGDLQKLVGVVFSDPEAQFTAMTVEDELVFGMENLGMTVAEIRERLEWVADLTGLEPLMNKPPYEISGGQKQRVALAAVLAMRPRVLVLDEPTSMLDPISRKRVFDVLKQLKKETGNTVVVIEHSLENLIPLADRMLLLSDGHLLLEGETREFFRHMPRLLENGITPPGALRFFYEMARRGRWQGDLPLDVDEAAGMLAGLFDNTPKEQSL